MNELEQLGRRLRRSFVLGKHKEEIARPAPALLARLGAVRQALAPPRGRYSDARIAKGIMSFRLLGTKTAYPDLKYACYGIARPMDWEGRILLAEEALVDQLLAAVAAQSSHPDRFAACCRGLAAAWQAAIDADQDALQNRQLRAGAGKLQLFLLDNRHALIDTTAGATD